MKMRLGVAVVVVLVGWVMVALGSEAPAPIQGQRIAVIGAGIGGASFAYHLSLLQPGAQVTIFEARDYIGGRLTEVEFAGTLVEVGGDAWSSVNPLMQQVTQALNIPLSNSSYDGNGKIAIWTDEGWKTLKQDLMSHIIGDVKLYAEIEVLKHHLKESYSQRGNQYYTTVNQYLSYGSLDTYVSTGMTPFLESKGIDQDIINDLVQPLTRAIYDEEADNIHAFAGFVSILPFVTTGYAAANGNSQVPKQMIAASGAKVILSTAVTGINGTVNGTYVLSISNNTVDDLEFDAVVIASPIEFTNISFYNIPNFAGYEPRSFVEWHVTIVEADGLNGDFFNITTSPVPDTILTYDNVLPFTVVSPQALSANGKPIYKIFSNEDISDIVDDIFVNTQSFYVHHWPYTFPVLNPTTTFQPLILGDNLIYHNTLESVASAMEESMLSGVNSALLISANM